MATYSVYIERRAPAGELPLVADTAIDAFVDALDVSLQRWHQLVAAHPEGLRPAIERPSAMLWFRAGVEAFAQEQSKPGRPVAS